MPSFDPIVGSNEPIRLVAWNETGSRCATCHDGDELRVWDCQPGSSRSSKEPLEMWQVEGAVRRLCWLPSVCGERVAAAVRGGGLWREGGKGEGVGGERERGAAVAAASGERQAEGESIQIWGRGSPAGPSRSWQLLGSIPVRPFSPLLPLSAASSVLDLAFSLHSATNSLVLAVVTNGGRLQIFRSEQLMGATGWELEVDTPLFPSADFSLGAPLCSSASICFPPSSPPSLSSSSSPSSLSPPSRSSPPLCLLVGTRGKEADANTCKIWIQSQKFHCWYPAATLSLSNEEMPAVNQVAWAPSIGRSHDLVALACAQGLMIFEIHYNENANHAVEMKLHNTHGEVNEVAWDMGGFSLASLGMDNMIRVWKVGVDGVWDEQNRF